jgi:prophage regulatory protein
MPSKMLRLPAVKKKTGLSRSSIYLRISQGTFPKQINLGVRAVAWVESEILDWIDSRIQARNAEVESNEASS